MAPRAQGADDLGDAVIVTFGGRTQIITNGTNHVRGYDPELGAELWEGPGLDVQLDSVAGIRGRRRLSDERLLRAAHSLP